LEKDEKGGKKVVTLLSVSEDRDGETKKKISVKESAERL